jgi:hypothetical protein
MTLRMTLSLKCNIAQHYKNTQHNDIQHNDTQENGSQTKHPRD